jgi:hypothetical protein
MLTAKEFVKDLGGEFVVGDSTSTKSGSVYFKSLCADAVDYMNYMNYKRDDVKPDNYVVNSFAWRPMSTLPDKPRFEYEVCAIAPVWRPLLDQSTPSKPCDFDEHVSDTKPVFTQEMADKGELPPVGSKVSLRYKFDSKQIHITGKVLYASLRHCIIDGEHKECHYKMCDYTYEAVDIRTPKQKAADEALKDIDAENDDIANVYGVIERMIAAGYKKC